MPDRQRGRVQSLPRRGMSKNERIAVILLVFLLVVCLGAIGYAALR